MFDVINPAETPMFDQKDPVTLIAKALSELAGEDREQWLASGRSERVVQLLALRDRLDAELLRAVGAWDHDRAWEADGALSAPVWIEHRTSTSRTESTRLVKSARLVHRHAAISDALQDGRVTAAHVDVLTRAVTAPRERLLDDHADTLVEQAAALSIREFTTVMRRWTALADDALAKDTFSEKWQRRHLHASVTLDGWVAGDFLLDPAAGQSLLNTLDHLAPPDPADAPDGPRTLSQRRADALVDLDAWYASGAKPAGNPPNLNVIVDVATLNGDTPELAALLCDLEGVGPVTRRTLDLLSCSATVTRIVMAGTSRVLDLGRKTRFATAAQRRALAIRDRHCRFPGCHRTPQWCDIHHIRGWFADDGPTDLANLVLLCRRHHVLVESTRWTITKTPDGGYEFSHPARGP